MTTGEGPSEEVTCGVREWALSSATAATSGLKQEFILGRVREPVRPESKAKMEWQRWGQGPAARGPGAHGACVLPTCKQKSGQGSDGLWVHDLIHTFQWLCCCVEIIREEGESDSRGRGWRLTPLPGRDGSPLESGPSRAAVWRWNAWDWQIWGSSKRRTSAVTPRSWAELFEWMLVTFCEMRRK